MNFILHPNFAKKIFVKDLKLSKVLLENESHYPWLMLIPRRNNVSRLMDLSFEDQIELLKEVDLLQKILWDEFKPEQLNVAALGNKTPQLHVHVIARFKGDPAWPGTVFDHPVRKPYTAEQQAQVLTSIQKKFDSV